MRTSSIVATFMSLIVCGGLLVGCGDDDPEDNPPADTGVDTSADVAPVDAGDTGTPLDGGDADAGPLDFAEFVKGLIKTETKANNAPTTVDDKTFVDKRNQSQFTELFP